MDNIFESIPLWRHGEGGYSLYHVFSLIAAPSTVLALPKRGAREKTRMKPTIS